MNEIKWKIENTVLSAVVKYHNYTPNKDHTVIFDIDNTLITTKGKHIFPKNRNDWRWLFNEVPIKLKELYSKRYNIIFISNQSILKTDEMIEEYKIKINLIAEELKINFKLYASLENNKYRKPNLGIHEDYLKDCNILFFVGDAAGRPKTDKIKKDFSDSDYKFALNMKVPFYTPEEYFLHKTEEREKNIDFDIKKYECNECNEGNEGSEVNLTFDSHIIAVGVPASGKSSFFNKYFGNLDNYVIINQDTLKTKAKCFKETVSAIKSGKFVIIDATNPGQKSRQEYINLIRSIEPESEIQCFHFDVSMEIAQHCNNYRDISGERKKISKVVYRIYNSKYIEPGIKEGFSKIVKIPFKLEKDIINSDLFFNHYSIV